jgi:hypothetical protein
LRQALFFLVKEIEVAGPVRGNWPNYSKLEKAVTITTSRIHYKKAPPPSRRRGLFAGRNQGTVKLPEQVLQSFNLI